MPHTMSSKASLQLAVILQESLDHAEAIKTRGSKSSAQQIFLSYLMNQLDAAQVPGAMRIYTRLLSLDL